MQAVRENRYVVLPKDFEKGYKNNIKKDETEHEFYKQESNKCIYKANKSRCTQNNNIVNGEVSFVQLMRTTAQLWQISA